MLNGIQNHIPRSRLASAGMEIYRTDDVPIKNEPKISRITINSIRNFSKFQELTMYL